MNTASSDAVRPLDIGARPSERLLSQLASPRFKFLIDLEYAFQPIVNIHTGVCFGFEALLRRVDKAGFASVEAFFDAMYAEGVMAEVDALLRQSAVGRFKGISCHERAKLFLNLDVRILEDAGQRRPFAHLAAQLAALLETAGLHPGLLCLELNERQHLGTAQELKAAVTECRRYGFKLALDDFGTGLSGMQVLYHTEPDFIKIDRFFVKDIAADSRKRLFVSSMVNIAHTLGVQVIAEGVETAREYYSCRDVGCDYVQGYFVQAPTTQLGELKGQFDHVSTASSRDRRTRNISDQKIIAERIENLEPLSVNTSMFEVLERFRREKNARFFPVINKLGEPAGIILETEIKEIVYSLYGRELLKNPSCGITVQGFLSKCPIADINARAEKILTLFSLAESSEGVLIVRDLKYVGFLSASSLLKVIHEKNLELARDQNPLTRLPGNFMVYEYLQEAAQAVEAEFHLVYFDFDFFKPFNDRYGFREGDRAILLFADILKKELLDLGCFIGHIGGDDFFVGFRELPRGEALGYVRAIAARFKLEVESFYEPTDRLNAYMLSTDREGSLRRFPLLSVSAAFSSWQRGMQHRSIEGLHRALAELKKLAKAAPETEGSRVQFADEA